MFISYAQNGEDIVLWRVLGHIEKGIYVDVGAADPTEFSVTKAFYDRGWSGVNVEPAPEFADKLREQRPRDTTFALCAGEVEGAITLHYVPGTGLSTVSDEHLDVISDGNFAIVDLETEVQRLDKILHSAALGGSEIHFLKVDVEGGEETVLRSIDLQKWRPWVVLVEATEPLSTKQTHAAWEAILLDNAYDFYLFDGLNRFYAAREHPELTAALSYPAGVFDQPYTVGTGQNELASRTEALLIERDQLLAAYARLTKEQQLSVDGYRSLQATYNEAISSFDALKQTYDRNLMAYQALEQEYAGALDGHQRLQRTYGEALQSYERLESIVEEGNQALNAARSDAEEALHREGQAERLALELRAQLQAAEARVAAFEASTSWKVTKPLRAVKRLRRHAM